MNRKRPSSRRPAAAVRRAIEALESRRLMSVTLDSMERVSTAVGPILANTTTPASNSITLSSHFTDDKIPGTVVTFSTTAGNVVVALTDTATPKTVANFLSYVNSGAYSGTIYHRTFEYSSRGGGSPTAPADIIQGGGYSIQDNSLGHITTSAPVADEYTTREFGDTDGTLAMAKTAYADSATSDFFFNNHDNTAALDTPAAPAMGAAVTSYTPFGVVLSGEDVVTAIASLNTYNIDSTTFPTVPVTGISDAQIKAGQSISANNLVYTNSVTAVAGTTYTVTSDNPSLVTPTVASGVLSFAYGTGKTGVADVTVVAKNYDGTSVTSTFPVTVPGAATTPTAVNDAEPVVVTGTSQTFNPLANDTSTATAAFAASGLTITAAPAHGTATVDATTGQISYTPTAGYTGADSLQYTVTDTGGAISNAATVALTVVPTAVTVSLGGSNPSSVTYTQPDGAVATIKLSGPGASAVVTFADYNVTVNKGAGGYTASGSGATVTNVNVTNTRLVLLPTISIASNKAISIGGVTDAGAMNGIYAPTTTLTGTTTIGGGFGGGLGRLQVAGLNGANISLANHPPGEGGTQLTIPSAVNSSLAAVNLSLLRVGSWTTTDGGTYAVRAASISRLQVDTAFSPNLQLTGGGYDLISGKVNAPSGEWQLAGSIFNLAVTNPAAGTFGLNGNGIIQKMAVTGNLSSTVSVAAINSLTVTGNLSSAVVQTSAAFVAKAVQLRSLRVGGTIDSSVVFATGNIGTVTAAAMTGSRIYAGVAQTVAQSAALPTGTADLTSNATIQAVTLPASGTFANTQVAAYAINAARLGTVTTANNGTAFGVAGHTVKSVTATLTGGKALKLAAPQLKIAATVSAYLTAQKIDLGNFEVSLF